MNELTQGQQDAFWEEEKRAYSAELARHAAALGEVSRRMARRLGYPGAIAAAFGDAGEAGPAKRGSPASAPEQPSRADMRAAIERMIAEGNLPAGTAGAIAAAFNGLDEAAQPAGQGAPEKVLCVDNGAENEAQDVQCVDNGTESARATLGALSLPSDAANEAQDALAALWFRLTEIGTLAGCIELVQEHESDDVRGREKVDALASAIGELLAGALALHGRIEEAFKAV